MEGRGSGSGSGDRLNELYPKVDEFETPLPRGWSPWDKLAYLELTHNNLRVHYKGCYMFTTRVITTSLHYRQ